MRLEIRRQHQPTVEKVIVVPADLRAWIGDRDPGQAVDRAVQAAATLSALIEAQQQERKAFEAEMAVNVLI